MQQVYSPFRKPGRPNQIIDILGKIRPRIDSLNSYFNSGNHAEVIRIYEELIAEYKNFETDLGKIAFAYFQLGQFEKAEAYIERMLATDMADADDLLILCKIYLQRGAFENAVAISDYLVKEYHLPEAALLQAEAYRHTGQQVLEMHAYFDLIRQEDVAAHSVLRMKAYTELARLSLNASKEDAEYYMYMCLQDLRREDIETLEFRNALTLVSNSMETLASERVKSLLTSYNLQFGHMIHRMYSEQFEKIKNIPSVEVMLLEMTDELIEKSMSSIDQFRKELEKKGDCILRSLNDHFITEQPTLAYSTR